MHMIIPLALDLWLLRSMKGVFQELKLVHNPCILCVLSRATFMLLWGHG